MNVNVSMTMYRLLCRFSEEISVLLHVLALTDGSWMFAYT